MWLEWKSNTSKDFKFRGFRNSPLPAGCHGNGVHRFTQHAWLHDVTTTNRPAALMSISIQSNGKNKTLRIAPSRLNSVIWNHKWGNNSTAASLIVMVIYWQLSPPCWLQEILCTQSWYSPRVVGHKNRTLCKPFGSFYYLFLHGIYKNNKVQKGTWPEYQEMRRRGSDDNAPSPPLSPELSRPQHRRCSSSPGCSRRLRGLDLHYRDRALTARPPRRPYPNRHTARQYTLAHLLVYANTVWLFLGPGPKRIRLLSGRILCQNFSLTKTWDCTLDLSQLVL